MTNLQPQTGRQNQSMARQIIRFGQRLITPHPTVTDSSIRERAQLLNIITLTLALAFAIGLLFRPQSVVPFEIFLFISICSFLLGKSPYPRAGGFLFSVSMLSTSFINLYFGYSIDYSGSVLSTVPIALIVASALTSPQVFAGLVVYVALIAFLAPYYIVTPGVENEFVRDGGIVTVIGIVLYGITVFRANFENLRKQELQVTHQELQKIQTTLAENAQEYQQAVEDSKRQAEERATRLRIISELSQEISAGASQNPNELLTYIAQITSQELGYYHVGIFLLDKDRQYAELRASNSVGGQRMLKRRHQLKVGGTGIVGYVSQSGFPRIALSTGTDAVFFNNPDLPDTQSEMALPLKISNQVIGVLDVQSNQPAAFTEEDTLTFTTLANQIALVIQNVQAGEQTAASITPGKFVKKTSAILDRKEKQSGYAYLPDGTISSVQNMSNAALDRAITSGEIVSMPSSSRNPLPILAVPVKVRDDVIGYIHIESAEAGKKWTEDEIEIVQSISERAALALENARLFEETERRAKQEQVMAQVTATIGESTNFESVLQTAIQEIGRTLGAKRTFIQLDLPSDGKGKSASAVEKGS